MLLMKNDVSNSSQELSDAPKKKSLIRNIAGKVFKLALAAVIVWWLVAKNSDGFVSTVKSINPLWLLIAAGLYAFHVFANAWRWWILLRAQKIDCSLWTAVSLTMQSLFFSLVMPGGAIGGDLVRVGFLARHIPHGRKFDGAFTILMDRFTGMIGIFLVAILMLPFTWRFVSGSKGIMETFIYVLLAGSLAGICASVVVFNHRKFERIKLFVKCKNLADRYSGGMYSRVADALDSYNDCKKELFICVLTSIVFVNITLGFVAYCATIGITGSFAYFLPALAAITVGNIAGLLPLTPSGVGARDFFVIGILTAGGLGDGEALAVSLTVTALILFFNMLGGLFFIFGAKPASR